MHLCDLEDPSGLMAAMDLDQASGIGSSGTVPAIGYRISLQGWPDLVHGVSGGDPVSGRGAAVEFVVGQIAEPAARPVLSSAGAWGALDEIRAP